MALRMWSRQNRTHVLRSHPVKTALWERRLRLCKIHILEILEPVLYAAFHTCAEVVWASLLWAFYVNLLCPASLATWTNRTTLIILLPYSCPPYFPYKYHIPAVLYKPCSLLELFPAYWALHILCCRLPGNMHCPHYFSNRKPDIAPTNYQTILFSLRGNWPH